MNNNVNPVGNQPNYQQPPQQHPYQQPTYQPPYQGAYYGGYMPPNYNTGYPKKQPYAEAADNALGSMKIAPFVLVSVIFGLLFSRSFFSGETGIGMTISGAAFYVLFCPFILSRNKKMPLSAWLLLIPEAAIFLSFSLYSGVGYTFISLMAVFAIAMCQTTLMAGCTTGRPFSLALISDVCSSYLAYPFMNMGRTCSAIFSNKKTKNPGEKKDMSAGNKIIIGLVISIPVVLVLLCIFASADKMFAKTIGNIIEVLNISLGQIIRDIFFTVITMLYIMPLVVTLRAGYAPSKDKKTHDINANRPMDAIIVTTVLFAAALIYLLFVAVQFRYLFFVGGNLPEGTSYAEYCRSGFFELVFVIALTTLVIALTCMFTRHNANDRLPIYTKAALLLITLFDFIMIISASLRVYIYIEEYNMTISRLNAAILIVFMAICLVFTALKIVFEKLKVSAFVGGAAAIMLAVYSLADIDGFVAKYNVDQYFASSCKEEIDMDYLSELSVAAVPQLERLMTSDTTDSITKTKARTAIADIVGIADLFDGDNKHLARWSLDRQRAMNIVEKHSITEYDTSWNYRYDYDYDYDDYDYDDYDY